MRQVKGLLVGDRSRNAFACSAILILVFALWNSPRPVLAQVVTAGVVGTVTDATGDLLVNVKITVENVDTELKRTAKPTTAVVLRSPFCQWVITVLLPSCRDSSLLESVRSLSQKETDRSSIFAWKSDRFSNQLM